MPNRETLSSPNTSGMRKASDISLVVIHYTGADTVVGTLDWFKKRQSGVSAHYIIDRDGTQYQFNTPLDHLWHAGRSSWAGRPGCNAFSLGVELVSTGTLGYATDQIHSLVDLLLEVLPQYPITAIVGHELISPGRKFDPGAHMRWEELSWWLGDEYDWKLLENIYIQGNCPETIPKMSETQRTGVMPSGAEIAEIATRKQATDKILTHWPLWKMVVW